MLLVSFIVAVIVYVISVHFVSIHAYKICHTKIGWYFLNTSNECRNGVCKYAKECQRNTVFDK